MMNRTFRPRHPDPPPEPVGPPSRLEALRRRLKGVLARSRYALLVGAGILVAVAAVAIFDITRPPVQHITQDDINNAVARALASATPQPSYQSQVFDMVRPSVVRVEAPVAGAGGKNESAIGSGVVIDDRGTILTSLHVVQDAKTVKVTFVDGTQSDASVVVRQPENDIALLSPSRIPDDLAPAVLGDSGSLSVGDEVVAVGNPFGINNSLSAGVVSGLGRFFKVPKTGQTLRNLIQFDAAVNPGNSGGPLVDRRGEVIGIVTALLNPTDQDVFIGIGFAVPIQTAAGAAGPPWY